MILLILSLFSRTVGEGLKYQIISWLRCKGRSFLQGQTNFGDSVEDEWLVVYLLRELSRKFRHSWIRVFDSDGEFLLIEAADALPKWLNPDVAENRVGPVFLHAILKLVLTCLGLD